MPTEAATLTALLESRLDRDRRAITLDQSLGARISEVLDLLGMRQLELAEAALSVAPATDPSVPVITLTGTSNLWGTADTPVTLNLAERQDGAAQVRLTAEPPSVAVASLAEHVLPIGTDGLGGVTLAPVQVEAAAPERTLLVRAPLAHEWSPLGLERVALQDGWLGYAVVYDPRWGPARRTIFRATLRLDTARIPVRLEIPMGTGTWSLGLDQPVQVNALRDLAQLMGGADWVAALPPEAVSMAELSLTALRVQFDPSVPSWSSLDIGLETANRWEIAPQLGLAIEKLGFSLLVRPGPYVEGQLSGVLVIGRMEFWAEVPVPLTGTVHLSGAGRQPFPGFGELAGLMDAQWAAALPAGVADLGSLEIHETWLDYDLDQKKVSSLGIDIGSVGGWPILPGWLELEGLRLRVEASRTDTEWAISGYARGTLIVAHIRVSALIESSPGEWCLGLTEPLVLPSVGDIAGLIGGNDAASVLPPGVDAGLGALTVYRADIAFGGSDRGVRSVNVGFRTSNPWKFWDPYFILTSLDVSVSVQMPESTGAEKAPRTLDAAITGALRLGSLDVFLSATHPASGAGWQLEGSTEPDEEIPVGELLDFLLEQFGVQAPDSLKQFELHKVFVSFNTGSRAFRYECAGSFELLGEAVQLDLKLALEPSPATTALPAADAAHPADASKAATPTQPADSNEEAADPVGAHAPAAASLQAPAPLSAAAKTADGAAMAGGAAPAPPKRGFDLKVEGTLAIGGSEFNLTFDKDPASTRFTADWTAQSPDATLQFGDITELFGIELSEIPKELDLALDRASFTYDFTTKTLALTAHSRHYGGAAFIVDASGERTRVLFALDVNPGLNLRDLPVVGQSIPAELAFSIDSIAFWLASAALSPADAGDMAKLVPGGLPQVPAEGLAAGPALAVTLSLGEAKHTLMLGTGPEAPDPNALPAGSTPAGGGAATAATQLPAPSDTSTAAAGPPAQTAVASTTAPAAAGVPSKAAGTDVAATPGVSSPTALPARPAPKRAADGATWLDLQKTLGPLSLQRIGFRYRDGRISVLFDGGISIAGFGFSLMGLQVSSALQPPLEVGLGLDGLGLEVDRDPLLISGAFLRADEPGMDRKDWKYAGLVNVRIRDFGLAAVGVYASKGGRSSLFVFGSMDTPLGGPPAFFVTGLSAGVGFNSRVRVPGQDEVQDFPLVAGLSGAPAPDAKVQPSGQDAATAGAPAAVPAPDPLAVLDRLQGKGSGRDPWITDEPGHTWIAAGVQFTSFKMVNTRALLLANLGERDLSFALLGLSQAQLPPSGDKLFAQVGLQLAAVFKPLEGFLGVTAVLTRDSWLLDPACRLTGGFAFFLWFDGPHEGDFVLTVGGYHPSFSVPAHYPRVERLGFNWKVSDSVTLKGGTYFALTPSCIMAGVALEATYSSGDLKAWFRASADFLAQWHPFHFDARVAVSVGASYRMSLLFTTVTLSVEIGAELHLWGPPTGGTVHVDWAVISFTIPFGEQPGARPATLGWAEFGALLPPRDAWLTLNLEGVQAGAGGERLARPDDLSFSTRSAIPATELAVAAPAAPDSPAAPARRTIQQMGALSIRPMGITDVDTPQTVTVTRDGAVVDLQKDGWTVEAVTQNHPQALWGAPLKDGRPAAPEAKLLRDQPVGLRVHAPRARAGFTPGPIDVAGSLGYDAVPSQAPLPLQPDAQQGGPAPVADPGTVATIAATADADASRRARAAAYGALAILGAAPPASGGFPGVARDAALLFPDAPMRAA